jgi:DNA polymerase III alpha subunit
LKCIHECTSQSLVDDNNKLIFSEKRFTTFKSKYEPYKVIYEKNHKHLKFANWYFETKLLGYSHSTNIREVFTENSGETLISSSGISELGNNEKIKFVGTVSDVISRTSARGNKYARLEMSDESGNLTALMMDSQQNATYSNFIQSGKVLPKKGEVIILTGRKSNDIISINSLSPLEDKIYMKLSDVK